MISSILTILADPAFHTQISTPITGTLPSDFKIWHGPSGLLIFFANHKIIIENRQRVL